MNIVKKKFKQIQINIKTSLKQSSNCESFLRQTHQNEANQPQPQLSKGRSIQGRLGHLYGPVPYKFILLLLFTKKNRKKIDWS